MLGENKMAVVVYVMIADDKSFTSTLFLTNTDPSMPPTIQDLSETPKDVLIIDDDNTNNYIIISSPKAHRINPTKLDRIHVSTTNSLSPVMRKILYLWNSN